MPTATQMKIAELTKGMLKLKLFVIFSQGKGLDVTPYLADYLDYMIALERQGKLFASGPLGDPSKADGMTIVRGAPFFGPRFSLHLQVLRISSNSLALKEATHRED